MRNFFPLSLYAQLTCIVSAVLCAAVISYSWMAEKKHETVNMATMRENALVMAKNLAESCAHSIIVNDYAGLEDFLMKAAELPGTRSIVVIEPDGRVIVHIQRETEPAPPRPALPSSISGRSLLATLTASNKKSQISNDGQLMHVTQRIEAGTTLGWIKITYSTDQIEEMKSALLKSSLLMALAWSFAASLIVMVVIGKSLSGIRILAEFARNLDVKKGEELEIKHNSREVQLLSTSLNYASRMLHQNEQQLLAEQERLSVTLHCLGEGVIATDTTGTIVLMNKVAAELTGWGAEEAVGKPLADIFRVIDEHNRQQTLNPVEKVLLGRKEVLMNHQTILISRNGSERNIASSGSPIINREGEIIGVVLIIRDMTERYLLEAELARAQKLESLGVFAGGIAHDFNNILTAIAGNISLAMMRSTQDDPVMERLRVAAKATERAAGLSSQLLTFSRGGVPILKKGSISALLQDTVSFSLRGSSVKPVFNLSQDLWKVEMDEGQISQVIQNLTINGQQAMPEGGMVTVTADNFIHNDPDLLPLAPGNYVRVTVTDQGTGIPANILPLIFDPFFTTKAKGNGLGLAICHSITRKHHGYLGVQSAAGCGTTFSLYIPAATGEDGDQEATGTSPDDAGSSHDSILIMDDDENVVTVLVEILQHLGHGVIATATGEDAVKEYRQRQARGEHIGLVILDLTVPGGMGGKEALVELRAINKDIKAIVSSGYSNDPILANHVDYGFQGIIKKPFTLDDVKAALKAVFQIPI